MTAPGRELILASASPARARLLAAAGVAFRIEPARIDEERMKRAARAAGEAAIGCALALAEAKAREVAARHPYAFVLGADQILAAGAEWFDKPADLAAARAQLCRLRGRVHRLATAACVVAAGIRQWQAASEPQLAMRRFGDSFLDRYIAAEGEALLGSVGGYRIEGRGVQLFARVSGDYFAIQGLPLVELLEFLRKCGALPV